MQKKLTILVVVALLAGGGYYAWTIMRWSVVFRMKVDDVMLKKVARFPATATVIAIPSMMKEAAEASKVPTDTLKTEVRFEARGTGAVVFWYVVATVSDGQHQPLVAEQRVENQAVLLAEQDKLEEAGIKVKK